MSPIGPVVDIARGLVREVERTQLRARRGIELIARRPPPQVSNTPKDEVWSFGKAKLWRYRNDDVRHGPPVLMFLGLVGDSAIFDLFPGNSWAEKLVAEGFDVFLFDWGRPEAAEGEHDLGTYMDGYFVPAVDAVRRIAGADGVGGGLLHGLAHADSAARQPEQRAGTERGSVRSALRLRPCPRVSHRLQGRPAGDPPCGGRDDGPRPGGCRPGHVPLLQPTSDIVQYVTLWENLWRDGYADAHRASITGRGTIDRWPHHLL